MMGTNFLLAIIFAFIGFGESKGQKSCVISPRKLTRRTRLKLYPFNWESSLGYGRPQSSHFFRIWYRVWFRGWSRVWFRVWFRVLFMVRILSIVFKRYEISVRFDAGLPVNQGAITSVTQTIATRNALLLSKHVWMDVLVICVPVSLSLGGQGPSWRIRGWDPGKA
jgi:hypothetical protein